ncbi:hypothetical protein K432DRAFT_406380 [Lepidopterella palustris CBS 459.81]|uniref:Alcohol dehydrogenase-like N-terminal domain-containing protein n=1 Tax=Lepidopterella palustris CBS 459.81 TaxID=1314670 RepID=A0A8E2E7D9_9PEZI|nr:hypothetical protein K432DRAFT_406380 [Lepidopterella palustris CBS 459.81]
MTAVGLNDADVLTAMGANISDSGRSTFGLEGVGYITKLGSEVTNVAVGNRVMTVRAESVPDQLSDEEAATIPLAYVTVMMFLVEK